MRKFFLPLAFLVPFLVAFVTQDSPSPVAPPGCKWLIVEAGETKDGKIVKAVFLVCPKETPA